MDPKEYERSSKLNLCQARDRFICKSAQNLLEYFLPHLSDRRQLLEEIPIMHRTSSFGDDSEYKSLNKNIITITILC